MLARSRLEALQTGAIVSMKDMGAAGLTCTTCEQAAAGGPDIGMDIDLDAVPLRESDMEAFEIMMSESQERMLAVVQSRPRTRSCKHFPKVGHARRDAGHKSRPTASSTIRRHGQIVAQMTAHKLGRSRRSINCRTQEPDYIEAAHAFDLSIIPAPQQLSAKYYCACLPRPTSPPKHGFTRNTTIWCKANTVVRPGAGDAAVFESKNRISGKGIAVKADCNSRYAISIRLWARKSPSPSAPATLCAVGAEPAGVTDCLCFGNPEKPDRFWQFKRAIEGIASACHRLHLPVVSGNVSLYNETADSAIHPSPLIGMVGVVENLSHATGSAFRAAGDVVVLLGQCRDEIGGSEYLFLEHGLEAGSPPALDLELERNVQRLTLAAIRKGLVHSAHDCSNGGLAVALAESCIGSGLGAHIELPDAAASVPGVRRDAMLFGETQSRVILSLAPANLNLLRAMAEKVGVPVVPLGTVGGTRLIIADVRTGHLVPLLDVVVTEMERVFTDAIPTLMSS